MKSWSIRGTFGAEFYLDGEVVKLTSNDTIVPISPSYKEGEIIIEFTSNGYYDAGSWENPPEGGDERLMEEVYILDIDNKPIRLPKNVQEKLFDHFEKEVQATELNPMSEEDYYSLYKE